MATKTLAILAVAATLSSTATLAQYYPPIQFTPLPQLIPPAPIPTAPVTPMPPTFWPQPVPYVPSPNFGCMRFGNMITCN